MNAAPDKINSDLILNYLKEMVESKKPIPREQWIEAAFKLNLLRLDESQLYSKMLQAVAKKKMEIYRAQEKRNVSAAELEVETTDEYRFMRDQREKLDVLEQFIMIAKKSADLNF